MDYLTSWASSAASAVLSSKGTIPNLPGYTIGERNEGYEGLSIWSLHQGLKKDDQSPVSVFVFSANAPAGGRDRKSLMPLARNALKKLRSLRHPNVLKFIDGTETDVGVWIITEAVQPLKDKLLKGSGETTEWKMWGLSRVANALKFINASGGATHGNLRVNSVFILQSGEWRLGGFDVLSSPKDEQPVLYSYGGLLPSANLYASPEVRKGGWDALKELDPSALDSFQLYLFIYEVFNGPLPSSFYSESNPQLPQTRGQIPESMAQTFRRLGNPNPRSRLKCEAFCDLGMQDGTGFFRSNKLLQMAEILDNFTLASESQRSSLLTALRQENTTLPADFLKYKVLPSLTQAFEFGASGSVLLPIMLKLATDLPQSEYNAHIVHPLVRMFASPDRAMRIALLEHLEAYVDKLDNKIVADKVWPNLLTGFTDVVPIIREATVKSVILLAPKLSDRILNNDLLRYLAKAQQDAEAGIRTNTCILLGRLSKYLQPSTQRRVLVPAFARAMRDPFVHARIAGLMALMATVECYEREDLATKVIPSMSVCLVDKQQVVRQQAFKAIDMFVKRTELLTADMPETQESVMASAAQANGTSPSAPNPPGGIATSAAGAGMALAGWAFTSLSKKLNPADLQSEIARPTSAPATNGSASHLNVSLPNYSAPSTAVTSPVPSTSTSFEFVRSNSEQADWNNDDLMDVNADADDWASFEAAPVPLEARITTSPPRKGKLGASSLSRAVMPPELDNDDGEPWNDPQPQFSSLSISSKTKVTKPVAKAPQAIKPKPMKGGLTSLGSIQSAAPAIPVPQTRPAAPIKPAVPVDERPAPAARPTISAANSVESVQTTEAKSESGMSSASKDKLAAMREARAARMAALKEKKAAGS